ncbi:hypothetical protein Ddye_010132 [Dipteronia dyeriana]|uniref:Uncharacterized protein n=1 Tax=Dipteronia dyeriana TaxID=168575 RepID=A0AAD9XCX9_9ROSI|nr:hypothetical protein Ddye_010132 [Dipteronia dyeriana]
MEGVSSKTLTVTNWLNMVGLNMSKEKYEVGPNERQSVKGKSTSLVNVKAYEGMDPLESASACIVRSPICVDIMEHTFYQMKATYLIMFPTKKKNTRKWKRSAREGLNV